MSRDIIHEPEYILAQAAVDKLVNDIEDSWLSDSWQDLETLDRDAARRRWARIIASCFLNPS